MKQAIRKLHTQRGASLLVALMFFLVCAMVAAVIVGSATTNAMKLQQRKEDKQVYNSVSSAAKLLRDKVGQLTMEGSESKVHYGCNDYVADQYTELEGMSPTQEADSTSMTAVISKVNGEAVEDDPLLTLLSQGVQAVYQSDLELATDKKERFDGWNGSFTIDDDKCEVNVEVSIKEDYSLTFRITPADEDLDNAYAMTLTCEGKSQKAENSEVQKCTHEVTLQSLYYSGYKWRESKEFATGLKKTITTTISWQTGVIEKGVSSDG